MKKVEYWYGTRDDRVYGQMYVEDNVTNDVISAKIKDKLMDYVGYDFKVVDEDEDI